VFVLVRNHLIADPRLFLVLPVVISFSAAALGAAIPGFLELGWRGQGPAVRARGALALVVLTFVYAPNLVTDQAGPGLQTRQESKGNLSPNIVGNTGKIEINNSNGGKQ
jgi:hypothetical protein